MYEKDGMLHSGVPLGPRVSTVAPISDYRLLIGFDNGERRIFDAKPLFSMKVFAPLKNKGFFECVKAEDGTVVWPRDIDYCPDTLYIESVPADSIDPTAP